MIDGELDDRLNDCLTTVQHLEEENRQLRRAASSFGKLAERLNEQLGRERRMAESDRRLEPRDTSDRRRQPQQGEAGVSP
jgi:predicted RNase H-like nuclease (RuvC/YqgF family)